MKVIVAGGRDLVPTLEMEAWLMQTLHNMGATEVVSGCQRGGDELGQQVAIRMNLPVIPFPAAWQIHGKAAGPMRNRQMAEYADACILLPGGPGTFDMKTKALQYGMVLGSTLIECPL